MQGKMQGKFDLKFFHFINYSLKIPKCLLDAGPIEIIMKLKIMVDVFIHHEGQFNSPNSKVAVIHEVVQQLGTQCNSIFKKYWVIVWIFAAGEVFSNCSNQFEPYSSQDDCVFTKMYELMEENIGCTVPFLLNKSKNMHRLFKLYDHKYNS